jgi:hypothetical protein
MKLDPAFCKRVGCAMFLRPEGKKYGCDMMCEVRDDECNSHDLCENCDHFNDIPSACPYQLERIMLRKGER